MHDFYSLKIIKICFLAQNMVFPGEYSMYTYKVHEVSSCWMECSLSIYYVKLVDNVSPVFSIPDFVYLFYTLLKGVLKSPAIIVNLSISPLNSVFLLCILNLCFYMHTHLGIIYVFWWNWNYYYHVISSASLVIFTSLKCTFSDINWH